ncbi:macrolide export ATP-binding/permease protein MacB [Clostridium saccharobutylicum]|uniref:ABC transporter permease n=1 Tax=Clostridium saccharobutylicum TaxID=169679 RepID=UPI000983D1AA|nr:ABC transporter permease [Clostridium saccharobutylicum]AQS08230.1 macrolide export ATP-binding/permease protein MacB [Clostridium saccharobutylicum]MBC2435882.1 FtsX-like permease family protein [Clostridium saccharobutylicum]NSB89052.1 putative ABC transport system permease protein [Clostridium saccharobutylicum]NYC29448.1 putative ABC transport system permease protein [Clostridium saccharobutylicum]OOM11543.1 macrolide export ATP-binding/permease protein MacB [Clostridium saccharobutylic
MFIKENILLAIAGLKSSKMRALLTMLGIIIGISSVIAIFSIGNAITSTVSSELDKLGGNNMSVRIKEKSEDNDQGESRSSKSPEDSDLLSLDQINSIQQTFSDRISSISIETDSGNGKVKDGYLYNNIAVTGVNDGYKDVNSVKLISGRFISDKDIKGMKKVAVVSDKLVNNMFKGKNNPLGKEIKVYIEGNIETYVVIGVYEYEPPSFLEGGGTAAKEKDIQTNLYIPITTAKAGEEYKNYYSFMIKPNTNTDSEKFIKDMKKYIDKLYKDNKNWTLEVRNFKNQAQSFTTILNSISLGVSVIAAIALLVGGIGVMNIMLVSVTERTKEIGTRKALGAKSIHIKMQFITESVIICTIGGIIGMILGIGMAAITCTCLKLPVSVSAPIILISFTFSMAIGVFFGYYPAKKAASLDPIEALRYE